MGKESELIQYEPKKDNCLDNQASEMTLALGHFYSHKVGIDVPIEVVSSVINDVTRIQKLNKGKSDND